MSSISKTLDGRTAGSGAGAKIMMIATLKGTWYDEDGFVDDLAGKACVLEIIDGKAYDPDLGRGFGAAQIKGDEIHLWAGATFVTEAGELARVGIA